MSRPLVYDNGKAGRRSPRQLIAQEEAYDLHVEGKSQRAIARELGLSQPTVIRYLRAEFLRRSEEDDERREFARTNALAHYRKIIALSWDKARFFQRMCEEGDPRAQRFVDTSMRDAIDAQTRIDKLEGLEAPTKIDIGLDLLIDAIEPKDVTPAIEGDVVELH